MAKRFTSSQLSAVLALGLCLFSACSKQASVKRAPSDAPINSMKNIDQEVGKKVTFRGVAQNAKLGAIILIEDFPIYVSGLAAWKAPFVGKQIEVAGTLVKTGGPAIQTNEFGGVSAGVSGPIYSLENPKILGQ